jgi:ligand-binding sensor domain-containing protein/putative methionine-R-sulfoxide reductase with GAF domain
LTHETNRCIRLIRVNYIIVLLFFACTVQVAAQGPAFYHLSTAEGLSDNNVNDVKRDRNGILWIGTSEGLNSFDGNSISTYYKYDHPKLAGNDVLQVICDDENRIWLRTATNFVTMLDKKRNFQSFIIGDSTENTFPVNYLFTKVKGLIVRKTNGHYVYNKSTNLFEKWITTIDSLLPETVRFVEPFDEDKFMVYGNGRLLLIDYATQQKLMEIKLPGVLMGAARLNNNEILTYTLSGSGFFRINIKTQTVTHSYTNLKDQNGNALAKDLRNITRINEQQFALSTRFSGMYIIDLEKENLQLLNHDPLNDRSIGGDNTSLLHYDSSGYLFVTTRTSGLHYLNLKQPQIAYRPYFKDETGNLFDGFIQTIAAKDGLVWLGTQDRLISINRTTNQTSFINYYLPDGRNLNKEETVRALYADEQDRLWVGTTRYGILLLNDDQKTIAHFGRRKGTTDSLPSTWTNAFCVDAAANLWVATMRGICKINTTSLQVTNFTTHPLLKELNGIYTNTVWIDSKQQLWIGTNRGAWCYNEKQQTLKHYTDKEGLSHNRVFSFNEDNKGNIYIGTVAGLTVLAPNGSTTVYNRSKGLRNDKCEGILKDENGFLWIGNLNCLIRFDPATNNYAVYEEGLGFSHAGFRMRSCFKAADGEMFWGSDKGLNSFYPQQLNNISVQLQPSINTLYTTDSNYHFTTTDTIRFPYNTSSFHFYFSSGELTGSKKIQFLYKLDGYDNDWKKPIAYGQAVYSKLPPGNYLFHVKASRDGINWYEAAHPVQLKISKPWWQQTWFRVSYIAAFFALIYGIYSFLQRRKREKEVRQMIDYFAHSGFEHSSVDDILWDIARNCISRLGFEDCVIYTVNEQQKVLEQKAAYGPKSPKAYEIKNPITIPFGKGIVGDVAATGRANIINDTSKDKRYIVDDEQRFSEITVPIIHEGKVIAVIDSEHSRKNFFSKQHLGALQTIASLSSAKISRAMAMDAMKKTKLEVMELNVKMAESKFMNLRLQMNPHFMFNALSSIQHLIVSQQTTKAYKYLTIFSNFLRSLLNYAEKNFIPLDEELKVLQMYVELESLRFDQSFSYEINVDENLSNDEVLVPSLMVQPFVENAIWHGLLHKEGEKKLKIEFVNHSDDHLTCTIEDNGVGRSNAAAIQQQKISSKIHESKGIGIIEERLKLLQQKTGKPAHVEIKDMFDAQQHAAGTKVIITIPYYNPEET